MHFSTRLQRFAYARLLASYLTGSGQAFSSTLTTIALYDSSLRWFEARSRKLASRGLSLISCAAREEPKLTRALPPQDGHLMSQGDELKLQ